MNETDEHSRREFLGASLATLLVGSSGLAQAMNQTAAPNNGKEQKAVGEGLTIAILLFDDMAALDAVGPYEVLNRLPGARVQFVGETKGLKRTDSKMLALNADYTLDEVTKPDVLLIPGGSGYGMHRLAMMRTPVHDWVREAHKTTKWTTSVCTGSLVLGAAGIMQNTKATTHWAAAEFLKNFGAIYEPARYVRSGKIITAAGISAGIDMALFLAEQLAGERTARMLQLAVEYDPQPPFNAGSPRKAGKQTLDDAVQYFRRQREAERDAVGHS